MTAAYLKILIHAVNGSLFPDVDLGFVTWAGPPPEIVTVQSLLYASLATSLFASFLAMLGKQWVNRYLRNHGGSAAEKSRNRQQKLDGLQQWHFYLAIESLPVMLQLALLLLGCALSRYLWTISRTVAGVIVSITLLGVTSYVLLTLIATIYYNCPYQTPPSILTQTTIKYIAYSNAALPRLLRSLIPSLPSIKRFKRAPARRRPRSRNLLRDSRFVSAGVEEPEDVPLAVVALPTRVFKEVPINLEVCEADARCVSWMLDSTVDADLICSTVRFAADIIWYPEIAGTLSPSVLADLLFDCLLDGQVIPGKSGHATPVGMALASILSIQLSTASQHQELKETSERIQNHLELAHRSDPKFRLITVALKFITLTPSPVPNGFYLKWWAFDNIPGGLSTPCKLWLSRIILQTVWRWRCVQDPNTVLHFWPMGQLCKRFMADGDENLPVLKTNCFLIMAISLGLQVGIHDLYAPNDKCVISPSCRAYSYSCRSDALRTATNLFYQRLRIFIGAQGRQRGPDWALSALVHLIPFQPGETRELGFSWIADILNSNYPDQARYQMAGPMIQLLGKHYYHKSFFSKDVEYALDVESAWIPLLSGFLLLSEKFYNTESPPYPGFIALRILSNSPGYGDFGTVILPVLTSTLLSAHPLQSRLLALKVFARFGTGWFSPQMETIPHKDLAQLLRAVDDPFQFSLDLPLHDEKAVGAVNYEPIAVAVILIELASSELWREHLHRSNFNSCEVVMVTEEARKVAVGSMFSFAADSWPEFLRSPAKIIAAINRLKDLRCPNTVELVIMWAWTIGVVDPVDHDAWELIGNETLSFYQTHGMERLAALKRHITDTAMEEEHLALLAIHYEGPSCRTKSARRSVPDFDARYEDPPLGNAIDLRVSLVCQLRRLYHLFGHQPRVWKEGEAVVGEEGGLRETDVMLGRSGVLPAQINHWACDYP